MKKHLSAPLTRAVGSNLIPVPFDPDEAWGAKERRY